MVLRSNAAIRLVSRTALPVIVVLGTTLAAVVAVPTAGLAGAAVCADAIATYVDDGGCADPGAVVTDAVAPPEPGRVRPEGRIPHPIPHPPGSHPLPHTVWSTTDPNGPLPSGDWNSGTVHYEVGSYMSDGLLIYGLVCYPLDMGPHPVLIINHGVLPQFQQGVGLNSNSFNACTQMAAAGWLVATSTYRGWSAFLPGSDTAFPPDPTFTRQSQGKYEFCGGEVDDSLGLLTAVKWLPQADASRVLMWGHSHGSCITELAVERGADPQIAVSLDGPTDFTQSTWPVVNTVFGAAWCDSCGPTDTDQLDARSSAWPGNAPSTLTNAKFLRIQSEGDAVVVPRFGCELAAALTPPGSDYFLYPDSPPGGAYFATPKECGPWLPQPCELTTAGPNCGPWKLGELLPDTKNGGSWISPTFLMYACQSSVCTGPDRSPLAGSDQGLIAHGAIIAQSWPAVASFVNQFASGWSASFPAQYIPFY